MIRKIKLGDKITRGNIDSNGRVVGYPKHKVRDYRVIGLNPKLKLQEVLSVNGEVELGEVEQFDWKLQDSLRPMFDNDHFIHSFGIGDMSHIWVGDF
jgi:hypothetical protein